MKNIDLTQGNVLSHIMRIAVPSSVGLLFNTLFNVVDTIYGGKISTEALSGMSLSFPVFFLIIALSTGIGTGATALLSISIGKKDYEEFENISFNAIFLGLIISVIITAFSSNIASILFGFTKAQGLALIYGIDYTKVIFYGSTFFIMNSIINGILNSVGDTKSYRNFLIVGFFMNLLLDPLFIFGWFGIPKMGVMGVALATVIVQGLGLFYLLYKLKKSSIFNLEKIKEIKISFNIIKGILKQGVPSSINMMTIALGVFVINYYVLKFGGDVSIAAYGASLRIEQLALLPALGLNVAVLIITGQNYGSKNYSRIYEVYKISTLIGIGIMTIGTFIIYPFAGGLIKIFNSNTLIINEGVTYLRIEVFAFYTYVILNTSISVLQGIKKPVYAIYIGLYRQIFLPLIIFYLLGTYLKFGIRGIWWGIVIINWSAVIITIFYTLKNLRKLK